MKTQVVSVKQGIMMVVMYILGTSFLVGSGIEAGRDIWLAYLLALAVSILLVLVYGRIIGYFPDKDLYETLETLMGRGPSVVFLSLITVFLFQQYSYMLLGFGGFIKLVGLPDAPYIFPFICLGVITVLAAYFDIEVLGKWTVFFLAPVIVFLILTTLMLARHMDLDQLRPALENGFAPLMRGAWSLISLPFAETVAFIYVLPPLREKKASYKIYIWGLLIGFALTFMVSIADVMVLGVDYVIRLYYPTYTSMSIIQIGQFVQRLEIVAASVFTVTVFFKGAVVLLAIIKNLGRIFNLEEPRILIMPLLSLAINYAINSYESGFQYYAAIFLFWPPYSTIFQVIIPILLLVFLEYRMSRRKKQKDMIASYP